MDGVNGQNWGTKLLSDSNRDSNRDSSRWTWKSSDAFKGDRSKFGLRTISVGYEFGHSKVGSSFRRERLAASCRVQPTVHKMNIRVNI